MYEQILSQAGLYADQAKIYEILIKNGPLEAGKIAKKTDITRSLVYKILEELIEKGLVLKDEQSQKVAMFKPEHPLKLQVIQEKMAQKAKNAQIALDTVLPYLSSEFALLSDKPDIRFYENEEGIAKIARDSLTATTEIYSYIDNEAANKYIPKLNQEYVKERIKRRIKKKMITIDSPYIRQHAKNFHPELTEVRVIDGALYHFATVMQIYNNKVSYFTLDPKKIIGVIIEDEHIAKMHKSLFEFTWTKALPIMANNKETFNASLSPTNATMPS